MSERFVPVAPPDRASAVRFIYTQLLFSDI